MTTRITIAFLLTFLLPASAAAQSTTQPPPGVDLRIYDIVGGVSAERIEHDIRTLAGFGTRNTFSDTTSAIRGIGAARRWIKAEFDRIDQASGGKLEVFYTRDMVLAEGNRRVPQDTEIVNVVAIQRGTVHPNRYILMCGDIDSRNSSGNDTEKDAPGANDNASGMAGVLEAARVLTAYDFGASVVYVGLSGEEQGLFGGQFLSQRAKDQGWEIIGVLNNDMIGNIEGIDGVVDNRTFRIFSEANPWTDELRDYQRRRTSGGEVDGPSRQLARYVARIAEGYITDVEPLMIYRLDRFGRGGHHKPFNDLGFAGVRIMEAHENYNRQHQDIRTEDGIAYGDVVEGVDFDYARKLTGVNAAVMASLAWAPPSPGTVRVSGANRPSTTLSWSAVEDPGLAGYTVYWRDTTAPQWQYSRFVGNVDRFTLQDIIIDNYLFGVAAVGRNGDESVIVFPNR